MLTHDNDANSNGVSERTVEERDTERVRFHHDYFLYWNRRRKSELDDAGVGRRRWNKIKSYKTTTKGGSVGVGVGGGEVSPSTGPCLNGHIKSDSFASKILNTIFFFFFWQMMTGMKFELLSFQLMEKSGGGGGGENASTRLRRM